MTSKELLYVKTVADEKIYPGKSKSSSLPSHPSFVDPERIEDSVGFPLFNRTAGGLTLYICRGSVITIWQSRY